MILGQFRRGFHHMRERVARLERGDDALQFGAKLKRLQRFIVGGGGVVDARRILKPRMFGAERSG